MIITTIITTQILLWISPIPLWGKISLTAIAVLETIINNL